MCLSSSNSPAERAFNLLTIIISDCRLSMSHEAMEEYMIASENSNARTEQEKEDILKSATKQFLEKRRTKQVKNIRQPMGNDSMLSIERDKEDAKKVIPKASIEAAPWKHR